MRPAPLPKLPAFSLVEVTLALGVFAVLALALIGLLGGGLQSARSIQGDYQTTLLQENLMARYLLESSFPDFQSGTRTELFCDESGSPTTKEEAVFFLTLQRIAPPHWSGDFLEAVRVEMRRNDGSEIGSFVLQRAVRPRTQARK
jgi:type II secretory pathway pseudopilin PulG